MEGIARLAKEGSALRHNSFSSAVVTAATTSSMLFYVQSKSCLALASMVTTLAGLGIFSLR
jgi:hypothetical protein